jgi:TRAP-type transport system periplasmic protein
MRRLSVIGLLVLLSLAIPFIVASTSLGQESITLRYTNFFPPGHKNSVICEEWCKEVEKRTNGKIKIRYFPGSTLTSAPQTYDSILSGVVDLGNHVLAYTWGKFPLTEVLDFPLGYWSGYVSTKLMNAYYEKFKPKDLSDVQVMYLHCQGPGIVHSRTPVAKMEDLKGMKLRVGNNPAFLTNLGGVPVAMPMGEAYDAISKGVVGGIMCPYEALQGWKLGEVVKSTTENYGSAYGAAFVVAMNKEKWNRIPPESRKIIEQINQEWIEKQGKIWESIDEEGKKSVIERGNKIIKLSPEEDARWAEKAQPLFDEYLKKTKEKNLPGEEVLKFAREYLKAHKK